MNALYQQEEWVHDETGQPIRRRKSKPTGYRLPSQSVSTATLRSFDDNEPAARISSRASLPAVEHSRSLSKASKASKRKTELPRSMTSPTHHTSSPSADAELKFGIAGSTPLPHLPLRKRASQKLRLGLSRSGKSGAPPLPDSPDSWTRSQASPKRHSRAASHRSHGAGSDAEVEPSLSGSDAAPRPSTARDRGMSNASTVASSSALRPSLSIPDFAHSPLSPQLDSFPSPRPDARTSTSVVGPRTSSNRPVTIFKDGSVEAGFANSPLSPQADLLPSPSPETRTSTSTVEPRTSANRPVTFFKDGGVEAMRESIRSAMTNGSSILDTSVTDRSSFMTTWSSASDSANNSPRWTSRGRESPGGGMSVEDAIMMYANGFVDDPAEPTLADLSKLDSPTLPDGQFIPSPEAFSELQELPPVPKPFASAASFNNVRTSAQIMAGQLYTPHESDCEEEAGAEADSVRVATPNRDRYGFKKETQYITSAQYDAWNREYSPYLDRRKKKWTELMAQHGLSSDKPKKFPPKSDKLKRFVRKGIPPDWRGAAWFWYGGGQAALLQNPDLYSKLVERVNDGQINDGDREHIERDLNRTFPDNILFKADPEPILNGDSDTRNNDNVTPKDTPMICSLRRVLQAFAIHNPKVGYCQSLNFLAGHLLIFLSGNEEKAFHLLVILTSEHLPGTHGIALEGINVDNGVLMTSLKEAMPALWAKLDDRVDTVRRSSGRSRGDLRVNAGLPTVSLTTMAWFMGCFVATLPVESACRVWDCLFYEGTKTLFRVALGVLWLCEPAIRRTTDPMEAFQIVQTLPKRLVDANAVMEAALKTKGLLSQEAVQRLREERRLLYQRERERLLMMATGGENGDDARKSVVSVAEADARPLSRGLGRATSRARLRRSKSKKTLVQ